MREILCQLQYVRIYLDDSVPEYMDGIFRIGSVTSEDENGNENTHDDLVNDQEFRSYNDLIKYVAKALNVNQEIVEIEE